ncbi:MAG: HAMP domain-containing histidine kinase [Gracilibacteraceae bacterium]|jgi:two-component system OmpR family sensor kinase|nr:HAMP domain-containing histidine kinase [Gracilibacteraceae bacterium]
MSESAFVAIKEDVREWSKSLSGQLLIRFIICIAIFFLAVGLIQYFSLERALYSNLEHTLQSTLITSEQNIAAWFQSQPSPAYFSRPELSEAITLTLYNRDGTVHAMAYGSGATEDELVLFSGEDERPAFDPAQAAVDRRHFILSGANGREYMVISRAVRADQLAVMQIISEGSKNAEWVRGYVAVSAPVNEVKLILARNYVSYVFTAWVVLVFSIIFTYLVVRRPLKPLTTISETARQIARGHYHARISETETATTEIDQLRKSLNQMMEQIETALIAENHAKEKMARFIGDASHELKTPLTSIRGYLEILRRNDHVDAAALAEALRAMSTETERLIRLTEALLALNRISVYAPARQADEGVTLREVMEDSMPLLTPLLGERKLKLNGELYDKDCANSALLIRFPLRRDEMKQVLYNLVNNAIQYTTIDGLIEILATEEGEEIVFAVRDNGLGIEAKDIPFVFDRFFRGERSRQHKAGQGAGLGLSIVAEITRIRGGKISVESEVGKGTMFILRFRPRAKF